jgi:hypothetical protein
VRAPSGNTLSRDLIKTDDAKTGPVQRPRNSFTPSSRTVPYSSLPALCACARCAAVAVRCASAEALAVAGAFAPPCAACAAAARPPHGATPQSHGVRTRRGRHRGAGCRRLRFALAAHGAALRPPCPSVRVALQRRTCAAFARRRTSRGRSAPRAARSRASALSPRSPNYLRRSLQPSPRVLRCARARRPAGSAAPGCQPRSRRALPSARAFACCAVAAAANIMAACFQSPRLRRGRRHLCRRRRARLSARDVPPVDAPTQEQGARVRHCARRASCRELPVPRFVRGPGAAPHACAAAHLRVPLTLRSSSSACCRFCCCRFATAQHRPCHGASRTSRAQHRRCACTSLNR